jgi:hypothetical protein
MALKKQKPITIAEWRRNRKERIRISLCVYQGRNVIDLRLGGRTRSAKTVPAGMA